MVRKAENIPSSLSSYLPLLETIAIQFGENCEVALHDLSQPPSSLIAIAGNLTHRHLGAPITDYVLQLLKRYGDDVNDSYIYFSLLPGGRKNKASTTFLRDSQGHVIGCFCINFNLDYFIAARSLLDDVLSIPSTQNEHAEEHYVNDVAEATNNVLNSVIEKCSKPVSHMNREDKIEIVRELEKRGIFMVKGAVEAVASFLDISKYTLYSYIEDVKNSTRGVR